MSQLTNAADPVKTSGCLQNGKCHGRITTHPANSTCTTCHSVISPNHPRNDPKKKEVRPPSHASVSDEQSCLKCHAKQVDFEYVHSPVAAGDCAVCHNPHGDKNNSYIKKSSQQLICYKCHKSVVKKTDTFMHGPVKDGKCNLCHTPHGSFFPHLLKDNFSTTYFNDYKKGTYKFCFRCHKIDLLLYPKTSYNTNFRDGKKNLHYLHVNRPSRGIACKFCHRIHAGKLPKLMAQSVTFGGWQMPINFKISQNGGSCSPGCHKTESYDRTLTRITP